MATKGVGSGTGEPATDTVSAGTPKNPTLKQGQLSAGSKTIEAAISAVSGGLQGLTTKIKQLADEMINTRAEQVKTARTEKVRNEVLATDIRKIWDDSLQSIVKSAKKHVKTTDDDTAAVDANAKASKKHTKTTTDNTAAVDANAKASKKHTDSVTKDADHILKKLKNEAKEEEAANKRIKAQEDAEKITKSSQRSLQKELQATIKKQGDNNTALEQARQQLKKLAEDAKSGAGGPDIKAKLAAANEDYNTKKKTAAETNDRYGQLNKAIGNHTTILGGAINALKGFIVNLSFAASATQLYQESQDAKKTGNYASASDFLAGQMTALGMGITSRVYNELNAQTRGSALTANSQAEFDTVLKSATTSMSVVAGTREEGAKLAATTFQNTAAIGISAKTASSHMDELASGFGTLSKITGKTTAEMAELTFAITRDLDHRTVMLGLDDKEREKYLLDAQQKSKMLVIQGYTIEQATELQKIALQNRTLGLAERMSKQANTQQSGHVLANLIGGPEGEAIRASTQKEAKLRAGARGLKTGKERADLEKEIAELVAARNKIVAEASEKKQYTEARFALIQDHQRKSAAATGVSNAQIATADPIKDRIDDKAKEPLQGNDPTQKYLTAAAGYASALKGNSLALVALTGVLLLTARHTGLGIGGVLSKIPGVGGFAAGAKGTLTNILSKIPGLGGFAAGAGAAGAGAGAGAAGAGAGAGAAGAGAAAGAAGAGAAAGAAPTASKLSGKLLPKLGGVLAVGTTAYNVIDVENNQALTREQKNVEQGGNVGGLAGSLAGAKLGAMGGAFAGPVGAIVGGIAGGAVGYFAGESLGKASVGAVQSPAKKPISPIVEPPPAPSASAQQKSAPPSAAPAEPPMVAKPIQPPIDNVQTSLDDLQRQFMEAGLAYYKAADPLADREAQIKRTATLQRLAANSNLASKAFSSPISNTYG